MRISTTTSVATAGRFRARFGTFRRWRTTIVIVIGDDVTGGVDQCSANSLVIGGEWGDFRYAEYRPLVKLLVGP